MSPDLQFAIEANERGAALYLRGALCSAAAVRVASACEAIPDGVRALRVDLRAVRFLDPAALALFSALLAAWRTRRAGTLRVSLPRERTYVSLDSGTVGLRPPPFRSRRGAVTPS